MKIQGAFKFYMAGACVLQCLTAPAQNVGINTNTPSPTGYGHGGTNRLLEIYNSNTSSDAQAHLVLSTGATTAGSMGTITWASPALSGFDKRMAMVGAAYEDLSNSGSAGSALFFWTKRRGNATMQESMRITGAGRVGIGTSNPSSALEVLGQLTIDQRTTGGIGGLLIKGNSPVLNYPNIGFSTRNAAFQDVVGALISGEIVSNATNAEAIDLAFYTANNGGGSLTEKMRIKGNGALSISGNTGQPGDMLVSRGGSQPAAWVPKPGLFVFTCQGNINLSGGNICVDIGGVSGQTFTLPAASLINYLFSIPLYADNGLFGSNSYAAIVIQILNTGSAVVSQSNSMITVESLKTQHYQLFGSGDLPAGTYAVRALLVRSNTSSGNLQALTEGRLGSTAGCNDMPVYPGQLIIQAFPK